MRDVSADSKVFPASRSIVEFLQEFACPVFGLALSQYYLNPVSELHLLRSNNMSLWYKENASRIEENASET